jgi:hypothetical protein
MSLDSLASHRAGYEDGIAHLKRECGTGVIAPEGRREGEDLGTLECTDPTTSTPSLASPSRDADIPA